MTVRLGADPEVLLVDGAGKHISSIGLINADKWNPMQIEGMPVGFTLQEDNVTLEYGIPPAASAEEFFLHINSVMEKSKDWLKGLSFSKLSCVIYDKDQMKHPMAHVFGCEPDWCAWTDEENKKPVPPHEFMRSAGGHIHVETKKNPQAVVKAMDLFLSVPATVMDNGEDRKKLYGSWGAYRPKPYGLEYRSLSNFWIAPGESVERRKQLCTWAFEQTQRAVESNLNLDPIAEYLDIAINKGDKDMAWSLIDEYKLAVV